MIYNYTPFDDTSASIAGMVIGVVGGLMGAVSIGAGDVLCSGDTSAQLAANCAAAQNRQIRQTQMIGMAVGTVLIVSTHFYKTAGNRLQGLRFQKMNLAMGQDSIGLALNFTF